MTEANPTPPQVTPSTDPRNKTMLVVLFIVALLVVIALIVYFAWPKTNRNVQQQGWPEALSEKELVSLTTAPIESSLTEFSDETLDLIKRMSAAAR